MRDNVMAISHHRQWRAWQFGRRHSGLFQGGAYSGGDNDPQKDWFWRLPWWKKLLVLTVSVTFCMWLYASGYILVFIIVGLVLIWVMKVIAKLL